MSKLEDKFYLANKYYYFLGQTVKHPQRVTCDVCPTTSELQEAAFKEGLMLSFNIAGQPLDNVTLDVDKMVVNLVEKQENNITRLVIDSLDIG